MDVDADGGAALRPPLVYADGEEFTSLHTASWAAVDALLPGPLLRPLRWSAGRTLVGVSAFRYRAVRAASPEGPAWLTPYGELGVTAAVTAGPALPLLPALRPPLRVFVLHLPVSTRQARDAGVACWGYPKFVADLHFAEAPGLRSVRLVEGGAEVLELTVRPGGPVLPFRRTALVHSVRGGRLLETAVPMRGWRRVRPGRAGVLRLGAHPVADALRALDLSAGSMAVLDVLRPQSVLPAGRPVGPADAYAGYRGADTADGRCTVGHGDGPPLDLATGLPAP